MLELTHGDIRITVSNNHTYSVGSVDNAVPFKHEYLLDPKSEGHYSSKHGVRTERDGDEIASCILVAGGGASGIHTNSAVIHANSCYIAVGPFVASLSLPLLQLEWYTESDCATCFGVYFSPKHQCLISHGELEVARLSLKGEIMWSAGGADVFSNGFELLDDCVKVIDFYDQIYLIDIESGRGLMR
ncbi:hypothetical protein [Symmachiella dynata]|uniref:hypothetical protein n=1 Tax=Symmachiella dynata TaxID=2527995 RepID=UPI0030ECE91A|tara:strand:- start:484 stop:1044 length:561 start_codon:yes stop_codon:yes gene_type:complete